VAWASFFASLLLAAAFAAAHWNRGSVHRHHINESRLWLGCATQVGFNAGLLLLLMIG
jgi:hypothetical protein